MAGLLLLAHWTDDRDLLAALKRLPEHLRKAIDCDWMPVAGALTGENSLFILGRGPSAAIANEAALKFKETCAMHAEAYSAAEVMHGPLALVGQGFPVVALAARDASEPSIVSAADLLVRQGRVGLHHVGARRQGADAAACRDRPSDHRSADADRILLRLRRGLRAPSRPQPRPAAQFAQGDGDAMSDVLALSAKRIFDGEAWHEDAALIVRGDVVDQIVARGKVPAGAQTIEAGDILAPGFVDLQVNGGGGVMLNDHPTLEGIETICRAHAPFGTTALLPTLITDTPEVTAAAVAAGIEAARRKVPGFAGLHLEGPHLSLARKGAHDPKLIRPMTDADLAALIAARKGLPALLTTVAPESVTPEQVAALTRAGIVVSLGHTDATYATAHAYADAGATMVTHLFNAMSQIGNREPGMVGAALDSAGSTPA